MTDTPSPADRLSTIVAAALLITVGGLVFLVMPIYAGAVATSLGLDESKVGMMASTEFAGIALASILAPFWIRRVNWRIAALTALALMFVGNLASVYADTFSELVRVRLPTSFASGALMSICLASLADTTQTDRSFGIAIAAQTIGGTVGLFGLPHVVNLWGVDAIFLILAALTLLVSPTAAYLTEGGMKPVSPGQEKPVFSVLPFVGLIGMLMFFSNIGAVWTYLERIGSAAELSATFVGNALAFSNLVALAGAITATIIANRFGHLWPLVVTALAQIIALMVLRYEIDALTFVLAVSLYAFFWNYAIPTQMSATAEADPTGRLIVLATAFQGAGAAVGPATVAVFLQPNSFTAVYLVACVFCLISLMLFVPVCRIGSRR